MLYSIIIFTCWCYTNCYSFNRPSFLFIFMEQPLVDIPLLFCLGSKGWLWKTLFIGTENILWKHFSSSRSVKPWRTLIHPVVLLLKRRPYFSQSLCFDHKPTKIQAFGFQKLLSTQRPRFCSYAQFACNINTLIYLIENTFTISMMRIHPGRSILPSD